jgi:imidazoleglycerol-phosphate dehydratase
LATTTPPRAAELERTTGETSVRLRLLLDGSGEASASTGVGFLDHMLDLLARHARLDLDVEASGDLETGSHHTTEDIGIVLGRALDQALGDRVGVNRYGDATIPMDEALAACAIDLSGRPLLAWEGTIPAVTIGGFETELTEEFFRAVASNAKLTAHVRLLAGTNAHHMVEACFKSFARALRAAVAVDPAEAGVPSTKGLL